MSGSLATVKAGDFVMMDVGGRLHTDLRRLVVEKVTKPHIIVRGEKYRFSGQSVGGTTWSKRYIRPYDEDEYFACRAENARIALAQRIASLPWKQYDYELLQRVSALIPAAVPDSPEGCE